MLLVLVLLAGLLAARGRKTMRVGVVLGLLALTGQALNLAGAHGIMGWIYLLPAAALIVLVIGQLLHHVLTTQDVGFETLCACMAGFLMIGLLWSLGYLLVERLTPGSFAFSAPGQMMDGFNAFYLSFVTLSTIGFGDITPVSRVARMLAVMEGITGMFYVALLVARVVSIHTAKFVSAK